MDSFSSEWLIMLFNTIVFGLILAVPILAVILLIRVLRRGVSQDRRDFEDDLKSKLEGITVSLSEIKQLLEESIKR